MPPRVRQPRVTKPPAPPQIADHFKQIWQQRGEDIYRQQRAAAAREMVRSDQTVYDIGQIYGTVTNTTSTIQFR